MRRVALKGLWLRRGRALLTSFAVVLGVAMVCGTYVLTDTIDRAFENIFATGNQGTSAVVSAKSVVDFSTSGPASIPASLLGKVNDVPETGEADGIISASGDGTDQVRLIGDDGKTLGNPNAPKLAVGADFAKPRFNPFTLASGRFPRAEDELAVDKGTADKEKLKIGDRIGVAAQGGERELTIVGVARFGEVNSLGGATIALFDTATAQKLLRKENQFDTISVSAAAGVSDQQLKTALKDALGSDVSVRTGDEQAAADSKDLAEAISFIRYFLLAFGFIALGVGSFVIYNTLTITVAQRVRELATVRALGASARQVRRSVLIEGLALGVLASVVGIVVGYFLAKGLSGLLDALGVDLPKTAEVVKPRTIVASLAVGIIVTAAASIVPARRATRIPPVAAMQEGAQLPTKSGARRPVAGLAVLLAALVVLGIGAFAGLEANTALIVLGPGCLLLFAAVFMLAHRVVAPLAGFLGSPARSLGGSAGHLAQENSTRNPARTASTAGALMIGLALVTLVATLGQGLRASERTSLEDQLSADYVISAKNGFDTIPAAAARAAAGAQGAGIYPVRHDRAKVLGDDVSVDGVPPDIDRVVTSLSLVPEQGEALVRDDYATENNLRVGSELELRTPDDKRVSVTVAGVQKLTSVQKFDPLLAKIVIAQQTFDESFPRPGDQYVFVAGSVSEKALSAAVKRFPDVEANPRAAWIDDRVKGIDMLLNLLYVLLALSIVVSLFGMVNTLVLTVFERTREIGMLRAVGMSRRQVRRMVRQESIITALIGAALGLPLGLLLAGLLTSALSSEGITFAVPVGSLVVFTVVAILAGVLAAIAPARRAARLDVLKALQYE